MRWHRERRRDGLPCVSFELRETEIDVLAQKALLNADIVQRGAGQAPTEAARDVAADVRAAFCGAGSDRTKESSLAP
jgi:hypothetical protein